MNTSPEKKKLGRPPMPAELRKTARLELRLTVAQRAKVDRHGGPSWVEGLIDAACDVHGRPAAIRRNVMPRP